MLRLAKLLSLLRLLRLSRLVRYVQQWEEVSMIRGQFNMFPALHRSKFYQVLPSAIRLSDSSSQNQEVVPILTFDAFIRRAVPLKS